MIEHTFERRRQLTAHDVVRMAAAVRSLGCPDDDPGELIDRIARLEELKSTIAAAQARLTAVFAARQRADRRSAGISADEAGKGVGAQIALARRESPHRGSRHLGLAEALVSELPHTLAALEAGQISEWRATLIARETACLSLEHRRHVDAELAARPLGLGALGTRELVSEAKRIGYRLDPHAVTCRASHAASGRYVSLRPAPDTMTWLGALLPAAQGVAAYTALTTAADTTRAAGDHRCRGQLMADTLVERVTGQTTAAAVPIEVQLIMTDSTLLAGDSEPADLHGIGPIPAPLARTWLRGGHADTDTDTDTDTQSPTSHTTVAAAAATAWVRRLYTHPRSGQLVAMESKRRRFDGQLRRFVITADRICRTPWCDAPIRHIDHPTRAADGGKTSADNSQGLCEACNYAREAAGWRIKRHPGRVTEYITPTSHIYTSHPPPPVGRASPAEPQPSDEPQHLPATA